MKNVKTLVLMFVLSIANSYAQDLIQGEILDQDGYGIVDVTMILEDEVGNSWTTLSDVDGYYQFANLTSGWYYVRPAVNGLEVLNQACAFEYGFLEQGHVIDANFTINSVNGVAVDFGTISPSGFSGTTHSLSGNQFQIAMQVLNTDTLSVTPDRLVVEGYWHVPGEGYLEATVAAAQVSGVYAGTLAQVTYANQANYEADIELTRTGWPNLNLSGEASQLTFNVTSEGLARLQNANDNASFCAQWALYNGNMLLAEGSTNWNGTIR